MYCQKCYQKVSDGYVCPNCRYNNSPNLTQPNILFGLYKDNPKPMVNITLESSHGFKERIRAFFAKN